MKNEKLNKKFAEAVDLVNGYEGQLPADVMLKLYAFYKIANENKTQPVNKAPLINAFKANALIQAQNMTRKDAMSAYIKLVKSFNKTNYR